MGIGSLLLNKYRTMNGFFKIIFFALFIIGGLLWIIGNWTKIDTLIMFVIGGLFGAIGGGVFVYFNLELINEWIEKIIFIINW